MCTAAAAQVFEMQRSGDYDLVVYYYLYLYLYFVLLFIFCRQLQYRCLECKEAVFTISRQNQNFRIVQKSQKSGEYTQVSIH